MLRGAIVWVIWLDRNSCVFSTSPWTAQLRELRIWEALTDAIRTAWLRAKSLSRQYPQHGGKFWADFDLRWLPVPSLAVRIDEHLVWKMGQVPLGDLRWWVLEQGRGHPRCWVVRFGLLSACRGSNGSRSLGCLSTSW